MLIGFALLAIPLLAAVFFSASKIRHLSDTSTALVRSGVESTHYTQLLFQQISTMERNARLYQLLKDASFLSVYNEGRARFLQSLQEMVVVPPDQDEVLAAKIKALRATEEDVYAILTGDSSAAIVEQRASLDATLGHLWSAAGALSEQTGVHIEAGLARMQNSTAELQRYLFWQSAGVILLTALLVTLFTLLILRPIRQIDQAISQLGQGAFSRTISVRGPMDLMALGQQLEWLRLRLLELAQERNRFLRHMSHELKTPLANIREGTELLMEGAVGELNSGQREVTTILRDNGIRLQQLIENLLSFSAWQTRHSGLEITQFRLRPLIKSALETQQLALLAQRMHLDLKVDDVELSADRAKLKLILDNLLSNALKYSPRGGSLYIHASAENEQLVLDVADSGPGVPKHERGAIFDAFYSGRAPTSGHLKGTGIGLSVVSEFVQAHRGSIEIVDGHFPGAHFRVRLPLVADVPSVTA